MMTAGWVLVGAQWHLGIWFLCLSSPPPPLDEFCTQGCDPLPCMLWQCLQDFDESLFSCSNSPNIQYSDEGDNNPALWEGVAIEGWEGVKRMVEAIPAPTPAALRRVKGEGNLCSNCAASTPPPFTSPSKRSNTKNLQWLHYIMSPASTLTPRSDLGRGYQPVGFLIGMRILVFFGLECLPFIRKPLPRRFEEKVQWVWEGRCPVWLQESVLMC